MRFEDRSPKFSTTATPLTSVFVLEFVYKRQKCELIEVDVRPIAARLLVLRVRIPSEGGMSVSWKCCELSCVSCVSCVCVCVCVCVCLCRFCNVWVFW